jgi:hypothetical protein
MAWSFGDGFDCYATTADAINGYWDSALDLAQLALNSSGRFSGSQCVSVTGTAKNAILVKSSGQNDAAHHITVAFRQTAAISGTTLGSNYQLYDGTTVQCSIVFRSDGAILLTSGGPTGTVLATYAGAFPVASTWYHFEFEVVINNTTGSFKVRKNGNSTEDHTTTAINTRSTANNYANKLQVGSQVSVNQHYHDDLFWRSDASSVAWLGDIRCYTRMPASDASVTWSRTPTSNTQSIAISTTQSITTGAGNARYSPFTAAYDGTIGTATVTLGTGYTGNLKATIFASSGTAPTTILGSANVVTNPAAGSNTLTFGTPVAVVKGTQYWIGFASDTASGTWNVGTGTTGGSSTTTYASFPAASPTFSTGASPIVYSLTITTTVNYTVVNEAQQDATTSYVYSSTVNDADLYGIASIASTPANVIGVTTRAYMQKSDAGTRTAAVQLKSGATTVASPTLTLTTSGWLWAWRMDLTDPNTSAAWTAAAVNGINIGPKVIA